MNAPGGRRPDAGGVARRALPFCGILAAAGALLWLRIAQLQTVQAGRFQMRAQRQQLGRLAVSASRGILYSRDGRQLAWNLWFDSVYAVPDGVEDPATLARELSSILGVPAEAIRANIEEKKKQGKRFCWIRRWVDPGAADRVRAADLPGVGLRRECRRQYAWGPAASLLGFAGLDGKGLAGIERVYDRTLSGVDGWLPLYRDARGRILVSSVSEGSDARDGEDLRLTLDGRLQAVADGEIEAVWKQSAPQRALALVMESRTGAILACAARPGYDPNRFQSADPRLFAHPAASYTFEPGSTFKPFVLALALARGTVDLATRIDCHRGEWRIGRRVLHDHEPFGILSVEDVVVHSSNIGAAQIGMTLAPRDLYEGLRVFGFGAETGLDLPGEEKGILHPVSRWSRESIRSIPMGHEIAATPIQLLTAFNVFANGGRLVAPHLREGAARTSVQVIREPVVSRMRRVLTGVVERGTGSKARCEYAVAGKTGTSRKIGSDGRYREDRHIASFVAFAPAEDPVLTVLVTVDEPRGGTYYGGAVAAPVAREILRKSLAVLGVEPPSRQAGRTGRTVSERSR